MITTNKKKATVIVFLAAFIFFGVAAYNPPKTPQGEFKNLQVLPKDISHEDLDKIMHSFNDALNVKCMFCHVHTGDDWRAGWDFAADTKDEKGAARHMLKMTMDINANYFNWANSSRPDTIRAVRCVTCHRGSPHPDKETIDDQMKKLGFGQPPPPPPGSAPPPAPPKN